MPDLVDLIERAIVDEPPLALKEGGLIRDGFDPALDELRTRHARRQGLDRQTAAGRNRAHRHPVAEGPLQLGVRLLHRGHQGQSRQGPAALHPQADHRQRRAVHHPRTQGDGGQDPRRRGAERQARIRTVPADVRETGAGPLGRYPANGRRPWRNWTCSAPSPKPPGSTTTAARRSRDEGVLHIRDGRHPVAGAEPERGAVRAQRHPARRQASQIALDHRPEHGRQEHLHPPGGPAGAAGPHRLVHSRRRGPHRLGRPHLHPHRRQRRPRARPIHLHGRDERDGQHPEQRHAAAA